MRSTMIAECSECKTERRRLSRSVAPVQGRDTLNGTDLNDEAEATILAVLGAMILASMSVGCVIGIGIARTLGAR